MRKLPMCFFGFARLGLISTAARFLALAVAFLILVPALADDKPAETKPPEPAQIVFTNPLAMAPGKAQTLLLRGLRLEGATSVKLLGLEPAPEVVLKKKEKAGAPDKLDVKDVGDSICEVEFTLPADFSAAELELSIQTGEVVSLGYKLVLRPVDKLVVESEPNNGFRQALGLQAGQTIVGSIQSPGDVDVFEFSGVAGHTIVAEVFAHRGGSALDSLLSLHLPNGQLLAQSDDQTTTRDSLLKFTLPSAGSYCLVLQDANDRGGAAHPYRLDLRTE